MAKYTVVLIDTISIQNYVFGSNKLKENLGASYLVKTIYEYPGVKSKPLANPKGYIGGGNALLFFSDDESANNFVKEWSTNLLVEYPGVRTAVAISKIEFSDENDTNFKNGKDKIFNKLAANKFKYHPKVILPTHGLTAECSTTGLSMEAWLNVYGENGKIIQNESNYVSSMSKAKNDAVDEATKKMYNDFPCVKTNGFKFTNVLDELGSSKGEDSHIAIVHIDGNGIGERFENCKTLKETRELSEALEKAIQKSFKDLIEHIIQNIHKIKEEINLTKNIIPIRSIILGGDDVTFVCDGRLGIYFAKIFIEQFEKYYEKNNVAFKNENISACAGVAITKLKYPFYRGYQLAEELCRNAKMKRKEKNNNGSWIDWHISYGGLAGTLDDIREQYKVPEGNLLMRPYKLADNNLEISFYNLINNTRQFFQKENGKLKFPNSKIKELREVLTLGNDATKLFKKYLDSRELELPRLGSTTLSDNLFSNGVTPFYDMIELAEIYPKFELEKEDKNAKV